tara:strand:+ start:2510 stop:3418 length:909 start_codon:yes stop_codon:yes gene_type:complete
MSRLFKQKFFVSSIFCLAAAGGLMLVANAEEQQKIKASQAKKPAAPDVVKASAGVQVQAPSIAPRFFPELTPFEKQFQEQLNENVEANFVDAALKDVVIFYADITGANIVLFNSDLAEEGLTEDDSVSISLSNVSLKTALELILEPMGLTYVVDRDVVIITTKIKASSLLKTRVYPVADFGTTPEDYAALDLAIRNTGLGKWRERSASVVPAQMGGFGGGGSGGGLGGGTGGGGFFQVGGHPGGGLGGGLEGGSGMPVYVEGKGGTISVVPQSKSLVISQTYHAHQAIVELLNQLRQARDLN